MHARALVIRKALISWEHEPLASDVDLDDVGAEEGGVLLKHTCVARDTRGSKPEN
jgi:hypothetical protein